MRNRSEARRAFARLLWVSVALLALSAGCASAQSVFSREQAEMNPATVGLPIGALAPAVPGVDYAGSNTLVVVSVTEEFEDYRPLLERWAALPGLQIAIVWPEPISMVRNQVVLWPGQVTWVSEDDEGPVAAAFQVGEAQMMVTFFVDGTGTIVGRHSRFNLRDAATLDAAASLFAAQGVVTDPYLKEQVLWYGNTAAYPDFPLEGLDGQPVWLRPGRPLVVLDCGCSDQGQAGLIQDAVASFPADYPGVDFVWTSPHIPWPTYADMWQYGRLLGLDAEWEDLALPLDEYLNLKQAPYETELAYVGSCMAERSRGWIAARDPGYRLAFLWLFQTIPSIAIVDADGVVRFPPTSFPVHRFVGTSDLVVDEAAVAELRRILDEIVGRQG